MNLSLRAILRGVGLIAILAGAGFARRAGLW